MTKINMLIYESKSSIQIVNQAQMLIYRLVTKPQIIILTSTYILCYYLLYNYDFREKNKSAGREVSWFLDWKSYRVLTWS